MNGFVECGKVRKASQVGGQLGQAKPRTEDDLQPGRNLHEGDLPRAGTSRNSSAKTARPKVIRNYQAGKCYKSEYLADFFSGSGRLSRAARKAGFTTREFDINNCPPADLTSPGLLSLIRRDIMNERVVAAMLGPPCTSFSIARDRTLQIRSKDWPYGLPGLSPDMKRVVEDGNATALAAAKNCRWLYNARVPFILENPHSSRIWYIDEYKALAGLERVEVVVADYCQFGTKWRKRTRFLCSDICDCDLDRLRKN